MQNMVVLKGTKNPLTGAECRSVVLLKNVKLGISPQFHARSVSLPSSYMYLSLYLVI